MMDLRWHKQVAEEARRLRASSGNAGANWTLAETLLAALLCVYADPSRGAR